MEVPKPNQEKEKSELEKILEERFGFHCEATIFADFLPEPNREAQWRRFFYRLRQEPINELRKVLRHGLSDSYKEPEYNNLLIGVKAGSIGKFQEIKLNGELEGYGIKKVFYVCTDA